MPSLLNFLSISLNYAMNVEGEIAAATPFLWLNAHHWFTYVCSCSEGGGKVHLQEGIVCNLIVF